MMNGALFCTIDECMSRLFDGGKGMLVDRAIVWLKSDDARLEKCAAMIMGNFSRKGFKLMRRYKQTFIS